MARDVFGEVRALGQRAWHGLGVELPEGLTVEEGFRKIGLGWGTDLLPMVGVFDGVDGVKHVEAPDNYLHVRSDNHDVLGVVGPKYKPIANLEMARFADSLVGADATVKCETAGSLRNGRRVFTTVKLPKTIEVVSEDILELYVILSNAHDGTAAFHVYPSSVRVVCANTLGWSERDLGKGLRLQHTGKIDDKVKKAQAILGLVVHETAQFEQDIKTALSLQLGVKETAAYFSAVYDKVFGKVADQPEGEITEEDGTVVGAETRGNRVEHKKKIIARWTDLLDDARQDIKGIRGSGWAAYNAFSTWTDHERGNMRGIADSDTRIHSNLFGIGSLTKKRAWKQVLQLK